MIAHRLESLRCCQRLFVLESGKLVREEPTESVIGRLHDRSRPLELGTVLGAGDPGSIGARDVRPPRSP